jgi:hypothetical protein
MPLAQTAAPVRAPRAGVLAALLGVAALVPSVLLIGFGVLGMALPRLLTHPFVVLTGVALALTINVGASIRCRAEARDDGVSVECDVRLRYRGVNRLVIIAGGALALIMLMYVLHESFGRS